MVKFLSLRRPEGETREDVNPYRKGTILMLLATCCLSSSSIITKFIYREGVGPVTMLVLRFLIASAILWIFYLLSPTWRPFIFLKSKRQLFGCIAVGSANSISQTLYFYALLNLNPGLATMIFSFNPVIIAIIMLFFGESLSRKIIVRLALALGGLYFLTFAGGPGTSNIPLQSVILIILCALVYAIHLVFYQKLLPDTNPRTNTLYILSTMGVIYTFLEGFQNGFRGVFEVSGTAWLFLLFLAIFSTSLARLLMFTGVGLIGGTQVALIGLMEPVIVVISSVIILGERFSPPQWVGGALVLASISLAANFKIYPFQRRVKTEV